MVTEGFLVLDKPGGVTSHDVVAAVRRATRTKKVGHAGTLDPMATGVVVVGLGRATRLLRFVQDQPKEYVAVARFGVATDTLDAEGSVVWREPMEVARADIEGVLARFTGDILQVPPMVSALHQGGRRLYQLAREGVTVERVPRAVRVHQLELVDFAPGPYPEVTLRLVCGQGTYVRSLADDVAVALGGRAHLTWLRRTRVGEHRVEQALAMDMVAETWQQGLIPCAAGIPHLPLVEVDEATAAGVANGVVLARGIAPELPSGTVFRVVSDDSRLLAIYRAEPVGAVPEVVLA